MAAALVENNIPFAEADTFSPLFRKMFPDSGIAKAFASTRTKTTCIVNGILLNIHCHNVMNNRSFYKFLTGNTSFN